MENFGDYNRELIVYDSEHITKIEYDTDSGEMMVTFVKGDKYIYEDVNPQTFGALCYTDSVGKYFNNIKKSLKVMAKIS